MATRLVSPATKTRYSPPSFKTKQLSKRCKPSSSFCGKQLKFHINKTPYWGFGEGGTLQVPPLVLPSGAELVAGVGGLGLVAGFGRGVAGVAGAATVVAEVAGADTD